jgi:hypothetical protein
MLSQQTHTHTHTHTHTYTFSNKKIYGLVCSYHCKHNECTESRYSSCQIRCRYNLRNDESTYLHTTQWFDWVNQMQSIACIEKARHTRLNCVVTAQMLGARVCLSDLVQARFKNSRGSNLRNSSDSISVSCRATYMRQWHCLLECCTGSITLHRECHTSSESKCVNFNCDDDTKCGRIGSGGSSE